nr:uncharacterized protein LOC105475359 [Macaca nemestrina]
MPNSAPRHPLKTPYCSPLTFLIVPNAINPDPSGASFFYSNLPPVLDLKHAFFTIPLHSDSQNLFAFMWENPNTHGVPAYDHLNREKRSLKVGGSQRWQEHEWPPQWVIKYYGPATWEEDGSWGYHTPIYMLNRIIRLQAVLKIITNQTVSTLEMLAQQQKQMCVAIYQNRLTLDYLLAEEGGVCGNFNISNCCLNIDDNTKAVLEIASNIRKVAHVPVQTWKGWDPANLLGGWFSNLEGFKMLVRTVIFITGLLLFLPCVIPLIIKAITTLVETTVDCQKIQTMLLLQLQDGYHPISQEYPEN